MSNKIFLQQMKSSQVDRFFNTILVISFYLLRNKFNIDFYSYFFFGNNNF